MARLTMQDIKNLQNREKVTIQTYGHIPIINIQGPVHRPLYLKKENIRALVLGGYDVRLYKSITDNENSSNANISKMTYEQEKNMRANVTPEATDYFNKNDTTIITNKPIEEKNEYTETSVINNDTNIIYTYDDVKNKSNKELKEILQQRKVEFTTSDRNELIALIVESNPTK